VHTILKRHGRERDYFEIRMDCAYHCNPLHNDLEAYVLAYGIASLLNNLFGHGNRRPSSRSLPPPEVIILLHKVDSD
jgi:hypothetical protein